MQPLVELFLTSKVRLHCDFHTNGRAVRTAASFPDLKGQAPLRQVMDWVLKTLEVIRLFLTSKVRLHCDHGSNPMLLIVYFFS